MKFMNHVVLLKMARFYRAGFLFSKRLFSFYSTSPAAEGTYVLGCGSNVADNLYRIKKMPKLGDKGFFLSPFQTLEKKLLGGVTLNHLSWAALAGVPTGLLALQGEDEAGQFLRSGLQSLAVSTKFIRVDPTYKTGECHVFIQEDGERTIFMAKGATSLMNHATINKEFDQDIAKHSAMVTTEVSQVPLSGVLAILQAARRHGKIGVLDLDVTPTVCVEQAELGSLEELLECIRTCDVLKPAKVAAMELLTKLDPSFKSTSMTEVVNGLRSHFGCKLIALTDGHNPSVLATPDQIVTVEPPSVPTVVDATGAGDAFLGGLIAGIHKKGLPGDHLDLHWLGSLANCFGATCVQYLGGVPAQDARISLNAYLKGIYELPDMGSEDTDILGPLKSAVIALRSVTDALDSCKVEHFVRSMSATPGQIITSGIGKSGIVASRLSSSLSSIGILSQYVHAAEWTHGDLGKVRSGQDSVLLISHSGNTEECVEAVRQLSAAGISTFVLTGNAESTLSKLATESVAYNPVGIDDPFHIPMSSIVVQEAICNCICMEIMRLKGIGENTFKRNHPGGTIGKRFSNK